MSISITLDGSFTVEPRLTCTEIIRLLDLFTATRARSLISVADHGSRIDVSTKPFPFGLSFELGMNAVADTLRFLWDEGRTISGSIAYDDDEGDRSRIGFDGNLWPESQGGLPPSLGGESAHGDAATVAALLDGIADASRGNAEVTDALARIRVALGYWVPQAPPGATEAA